MSQAVTATIMAHFRELDDPRRYNKRHLLLDIVVMAICAVICGADDWPAVAEFAAAMPLLRRFPPAHCHRGGRFWAQVIQQQWLVILKLQDQMTAGEINLPGRGGSEMQGIQSHLSLFQPRFR